MPSCTVVHILSSPTEEAAFSHKYDLHRQATGLAKLMLLNTGLSACLQEFGKTKIYTALQEDGDDLSKEV